MSRASHINRDVMRVVPQRILRSLMPQLCNLVQRIEGAQFILERTASAIFGNTIDPQIRDNKNDTNHTGSDLVEAAPRLPGGCPGGCLAPRAMGL